MPYEAITCGTCGRCVREWPHADGGPFEYVHNDVLKVCLERTCGICVDWDDEPVVVMLDTGQGDMPCGGMEWTERDDADE